MERKGDASVKKSERQIVRRKKWPSERDPRKIKKKKKRGIAISILNGERNP